MKRKLDFAIMIAVVTLVSLVIGCDNLISGDPIDFEEWMSCPNPKKETTADLIFLEFDTIASTGALPGDTLSINIKMQNLYHAPDPPASPDEPEFHDNPNVPFSANLRIFMEDTNPYVEAGSFKINTEYEILTAGTTDFTLIGAPDSNPGTVFTATGPGEGDGTALPTDANLGVIGPEDIFLAEFVVPGLFADKQHVIVENVTIPRSNRFPLVIPDPNVTPNLGPDQIEYTIYGVLDAQDCIGELIVGDDPDHNPIDKAYQSIAPYNGEDNNEFISTINGFAGNLIVVNPYMPNLQIKYLQRTPTSPLPETGGSSITEWEILNAGIGTVTDDFVVEVYLSEDDVYDKWDERIGDTIITDELPGNTNFLVYITATLPYTTWRPNGWPLYSALVKYDPAIGDEMNTRQLPPQGPLGYDFVVYPCIKSVSPLIALVDPDSSDTVREAVEIDNFSYQGLGGNGDLETTNHPRGFYDIECIEFRADNYTAAGGGNSSNVYDISLRYNASIQFADNCSFAFYWSKNDEAQFGDYFCQRYWFQIQPGQNILLYPFGINFVWQPDPLPAPGTYRMVLVMDDIFKFDEPDEDNNTRLSIGTVQVS